MNNCIFCKIINNQIPCYKIYENQYVLAFLDIADDYEAHTLVVPKTHCNNILDCDKETFNQVMNAVQLISQHYVNNCGYQGVNIINNNQECAEQSVNHLHFHIIPRRNGDNIKLWKPKDKLNSNFNQLLEKLKL